jgi:hypothetical protein
MPIPFRLFDLTPRQKYQELYDMQLANGCHWQRNALPIIVANSEHSGPAPRNVAAPIPHHSGECAAAQ